MPEAAGTPPRRSVFARMRAAGANRVVEKLLVPLTRGRAPGGPVDRLVPRVTDYPPRSMRTVRRFGLTLDLDLSDWTQYLTFYGWTLDSHTDLLDLCPPGATVVDVGANVGIVALRLAQRAARVIACEPFPTTLAVLERNVALNPHLTVEVIPMAVGRRRGTIYAASTSDQNSGMVQVHDHAGPGAVPVEVTTVDAIAENVKVDLIKVDVEGFEFEVLSGAEQTIRRCRPVLYVEAIDGYLRDHGSSSAELRALIGSFGYDVAGGAGRDTESPDVDLVCTPRLQAGRYG